MATLVESRNVSSLYNFNNSISQALLPTKGMSMAGAVRVHDWASRGSNTSLQSRAAATQLAGAYPTANTNIGTTPSMPAANGSIPGGALQPGSIDQTQFKAMLNAASAGVPGASISAGNPLPAAPSTGLLPLAPNAALAAQGLQPASPASFSEMTAAAATGAGANIQNLTPAQFAALTGGAKLPGGALPTSGGMIPASAVPASTIPASTIPGGMISGGAMPAPAPIIGQPAPQPDAATGHQVAMANNLTMSDASIPPDMPGQTQVASATPATPDPLTMSDASIPSDGADQDQQQASADAANADAALIGKTDKNGVLVLNQIPDRETRQEYAEKGIKWRIVDNPASNKLFFGPDGKFGWDDVLDIVNPLQHIPLVNIAYRHFTGDQMNGSAELLGGIAFGPFSALAAIADLAVRSTTGKDIGENAIALLTGDHGDGTENMAQATGAPTTTADAAIASNGSGESGTMRDRTYGRG
jgi:hypothetical protein